MNESSPEVRSIIVERDLAFPPEKIWRALTQPHLIEQWLMKTDFKAAMHHAFSLQADWGSVQCRILAIEPNETLSYTWSAMGLESVVTWTLTRTSTGTRLRMEHSGFDADHERAYQGAKFGWRKFLGEFERVVGELT